MILRFGRLGLSDLFGYLSIASWLGAQFPQVVKNYRLQSCEGLSLPFLVTWLFGESRAVPYKHGLSIAFGASVSGADDAAGDATNLIGCILTDQLPFQVSCLLYLAVPQLTLYGRPGLQAISASSTSASSFSITTTEADRSHMSTRPSRRHISVSLDSHNP